MGPNQVEVVVGRCKEGTHPPDPHVDLEGPHPGHTNKVCFTLLEFVSTHGIHVSYEIQMA